MSSYLQETIAGQLLRYATGNRVFRYPEEIAGFEIPWENVEASEKQAEMADDASADRSNSVTPAADEKSDPIDRPVSRADPEAGLSTIPTQATSAVRGGATPVLTRTKSREQTRQYTRERFEIEQQEAVERQQSSIIVPQKTADGVTLVDWYTTDDPANPQNWGSWYKAFVVFQISAYTFGVYACSAIYTPAQPEVMQRFGLTQAEGSLLLSIYVLGYGFGPMVSLKPSTKRSLSDIYHSCSHPCPKSLS
jgi:MFS transporter, DHA1 family, multidrug resistance protein